MPPAAGATPGPSLPTSTLALGERRVIVATNISYPSRSVRDISWSGPTHPLIVARPFTQTKTSRLPNDSVRNNARRNCIGIVFDPATVQWVKDSVFLARVTVLNICRCEGINLKDRIHASYTSFWARKLRLR